MSSISITKLYLQLTGKLGTETADHITDYIDGKFNDSFANKSHELATKNDLSITKDHLTKEISRLDIKISDTKYEIIKWMFIFWIAQVASTFGFILLFIKK